MIKEENQIHIASSSSPSFEQHQQTDEKPQSKENETKENEAAAALLGLETTSRRVEKEDLNRSGSFDKKKHHGTPESASYVSPVSASSIVHDYGVEERVPHFPTQLHEVLSNSEVTGIALEWLPHGRSWRILRWEGLRRDFLARHFPQCGGTADSFLWHVQSWGFKEVKRGPDRGSYFHALFLRDNLKLCQQMPWPISYVVHPPRSPKSRFEDEYDDETYYYYKNSIPSVPYGPPRTRDDYREEIAYRRPQYEAYDPQGPRPWKDDEYYPRGPPPFPHDHQNVFRHRHPKQPTRSPNIDEDSWLKHPTAPTRPFPVVTSESQSSTPERDHTSQAAKPSYSALTPYQTPSREHPETHTPPSRPSTMPLYSTVYNETPPNIPVRSCRGGRRRSPFPTTPTVQPKKKFTTSNRGGMKQVNTRDSPIIPKVSPDSGPKDFPVAVAISRKKRKVEEHAEV